jgi:sulfatase maturation enzyme AslB (radical SAM superfamily)
MIRNEPSPPGTLPLVRFSSLWFQVTGLKCNLECTHCLVDSSPDNDRLAFLERDTVRSHLREAGDLGVKEIYFTGGEPFLHREMAEILSDSLAVAPSTVLTNGTLITERMAGILGAIARRSRYSLEIRVSLDHPDPGRNDAVRGADTHAKAIRAVLRLQAAGLLPIVTATEYLLGDSTPGTAHREFLERLAAAGVHRPRLKILPVFRTGKIEDPAEGGPVTQAMLAGIDPLSLQCAQTRVVTAKGIYACPILVDRPEGWMGNRGLTAALEPVTLSHHACRTCYETGMSCGNF